MRMTPGDFDTCSDRNLSPVPFRWQFEENCMLEVWHSCPVFEAVVQACVAGAHGTAE